VFSVTPAAAQSLACPTMTGEDATLIVPRDALADGSSLVAGDVLRAYNAEGMCLGEMAWPADGGAALTLGGDNSHTPVRDGALPEEAFVLRARRGGEVFAVEVVFEAVLAAPPEMGAEYHPGAIYIAGELTVTSTPIPDVTVRLAVKETPVTIPAEGGALDFTFSVTNTSTERQVFQAWTRAMRPDGEMSPILLGPVTVDLAPNATVVRALEQRVREGVMPGDWEYFGYVGTFPGGATDSSGFAVTKEGAGVRRSNRVQPGWLRATYGRADKRAGELVAYGDVWAEEAQDARSDVDLPQAFRLHNPRPNPTSAQATFAFEMPSGGDVRLVVYDMLGREVVVLMDGYLEGGWHEAVLEGRGLPSGAYLARIRVTGPDAAFTQTRRVTVVR